MSSVIFIMWFITIMRSNYTCRYIQQLRTPDSTILKYIRYYSIHFIRFCIIQWMRIIRVLILYRKYTITHTTINPASISSSLSTSSYEPAYEDTSSHNHTQNPFKLLSYTFLSSTITHTPLSKRPPFTDTKTNSSHYSQSLSHYSQNLPRLHTMSR